MRGSFKPFSCHLVGSASTLCELAQPVHCIVAALLHAVYQDRVLLGGEIDIEKKRRYIVEKFGGECEALVYASHMFSWDELSEYVKNNLENEQNRMVLLMRIADALEDMVDEAMAIHGNVGESEEVWGTGAWRVKKWSGMEPALVEAAEKLGQSGLAKRIIEWMAANRRPSLPARLRSGQHTSFTMAATS